MIKRIFIILLLFALIANSPIKVSAQNFDNSGNQQVNVINSSVPIDDNSGSITVDGTVTTDAGTGPWPITDNGGSLTIDGSVSLTGSLPAGTNGIGKLTANSGVDIGDVDILTLPNITIGAAIPAGSNTIGDIQITDGVETATVRNTGASDSLNVAIVDGSGNQITSFGGGTQYTEADTDASITGTVSMWEDTSDTIRATSAANPFPVEIISGSSSGTEYTEDDTAAANPAGGALIMVRDDALSGQTTTDGDNVAARGTDNGELYVKHVDTLPVTDDGGSLSIDDGGGIITVNGTVTADAGTGPWPITDNAGSITVDNAGTFAVQMDKAGSVVDANNSTSTPLGVSGVYTGTSTDVLGYTAISVMLESDVDSATDGMTFQHSSDNTNWHTFSTFTMDVSYSEQRHFQFPVNARYFRVVYTNGGTGQSTFRVQTILHTHNILTTIHRLSDDMNPDRSAGVMKSVLFAQAAGSGDFKAIDSTAGGNLKVALEEINGVLMPSNITQLGGNSIATGNGAVDTGTQRVTIASDTTGVLSIDDNGGALTVDGTITASNTTGNVASDSADSGNPVKTGGIARTSDISAVANNDRVNAVYDTVGKQVTMPYALNQNFIAGSTSDITGTSNTSVIAAQGAGVRIYVTHLMATNGDTTTATFVNFKDGTTTLYSGYAVEDGGGFSVTLPVPLRLTANTALNCAAETTGATVRCSASGYAAP